MRSGRNLAMEPTGRIRTMIDSDAPQSGQEQQDERLGAARSGGSSTSARRSCSASAWRGSSAGPARLGRGAHRGRPAPEPRPQVALGLSDGRRPSPGHALPRHARPRPGTGTPAPLPGRRPPTRRPSCSLPQGLPSASGPRSRRALVCHAHPQARASRGESGMAYFLMFALVVMAMASVVLWGALGPAPGPGSMPEHSDIRGAVPGLMQSDPGAEQ